MTPLQGKRSTVVLGVAVRVGTVLLLIAALAYTASTRLAPVSEQTGHLVKLIIASSEYGNVPAAMVALDDGRLVQASLPPSVVFAPGSRVRLREARGALFGASSFRVVRIIDPLSVGGSPGGQPGAAEAP